MQSNTIVDPALGPELPTLEVFRTLAEIDGACVTMYLGPHVQGAGTRPMSVRLRSMLAEADALLEERGKASTDRESILAPIRELASDPAIDGGDSHSLALFRSPEVFHRFQIPGRMAEMVAVERRAFLRPLLETVFDRHRFLLLALTRKNLRLLECAPDGVRETELPDDVPTSLLRFEALDEPGKAVLNGVSAGPSSGGQDKVPFTTDTFREKVGLHLYNYYVAVERGLKALLERKGLPLVLMGTEDELSAYRGVNTYEKLVPTAVTGSADGGQTNLDLGALGRACVEVWTSPEEQRAYERYERLAGSSKASTEVDEILSAAAAGRVSEMFVSQDAADQKGNVDIILNQPLLAGQMESHADDLVNAAIVETLRRGGQVFVVPPDRAPEIATVFASFRY